MEVWGEVELGFDKKLGRLIAAYLGEELPPGASVQQWLDACSTLLLVAVDLWVKAGRAYVAAGEPGAGIFNEENFMKVAAHAVKTQQELPI